MKRGLFSLMRRRPTLPHTFAYSTIGPAGLDLRRFAGLSGAEARSRNHERRKRSCFRPLKIRSFPAPAQPNEEGLCLRKSIQSVQKLLLGIPSNHAERTEKRAIPD